MDLRDLPQNLFAGRLLAGLVTAVLMPWTAQAQSAQAQSAQAQSTQVQTSTSTRPIVGLRTMDESPVLLWGGTVVADPSQPPKKLDVLIRGTTIVRVAESIDAAAGTRRIDVTGNRIYAGLIDAMRETDVAQPTDSSLRGHWNKNITPEILASDSANASDSTTEKLRSQGITVQLLAPKGGIIKGSSCAVLLVDPEHPRRLLKPDVFQHATLTVPRGKPRDQYPRSPMGATALLRQTFYDAQWYADAKRVYRNHPLLPSPEPNTALDKLSATIDSMGTIVIDAANERMAKRAIDIANEFSLSMILRGSGREYRELNLIADSGKPVLLPVNFPDAPNSETPESIRETPLVDWMHWHLAPENPARLEKAGVTFCLTTDTLDDPKTFLKQIRVAIDRGLSPTAALAAVTTTPAKLMGIDEMVGRVDTGMLANLLVTDGDLFDKDTRVIETWVAGQRFKIDQENETKNDALAGDWKLEIPIEDAINTVKLTIQSKKKSLVGTLSLPESPTSNNEDASPDQQSQTDTATVELTRLIRQRERLSASLELNQLIDTVPKGVYQLSLLTIASQETDQEDKDGSGLTVFASLKLPDGSSLAVSIHRIDEEDKSESESKSKSDSAADIDDSESDEFAIDLLQPLGAYGLTEKTERPESVVFRDATVWTSGPNGKLSGADVWVKDGKIAAVGVGLETDEDCETIDCQGKHITPGLIDCHSHIASDGGINESGQAVTAEVRIGDFIDNSDISIYRQLAGGVTTINILHGSANPIGGQSQTIKLRWGESMDAMKFSQAPPGIKFALGENVKANRGRYPNTRMGVEQILRDQFLAARQYEADHQKWASGDRSQLPPRRDLQLEAILEIQKGQRWIHCHSYRQDEIVATLDVLEEFGVRIGTLQHILEGYKVADRIARHGAMASTFADWWAYKYEAFDAIPFNAVLMHQAGVVVSFNSDFPELARHLNTEAAKAIKYGNVPEQDALKFVTLNPAKQLRIVDRVGSIEVGKDADLVIWSGRPLSTTSRCEQTWIDGRMYFSLAGDAEMRIRDQRLRARLIQLAVGDKQTNGEEKSNTESGNDPDDEPEEDRWLRYDEFCNAGSQQKEAQ